MLTTTLSKTYTDKQHESVPCPLCVNLPAQDVVLATKGYPGIPVQNVICRRCGVIRVNPRMTAKGYEDFYKEDFFEYLNPYSRPAYVEEIEHTRDDDYLTPVKRTRLPYILPYVKQGGRVLDVGAGFGQILYLLQKEKGVTTVGIEPDPFSREVAKEKSGVELIDTTVEEYVKTNPEPFDFIYMDQVFEHLLSPLESLRDLKRLLKPDGVMYIGVPNAWNPQIPMAIFYQIAHTYNYTPATMRRFVEDAGLKVIALADPEGYPLEVLVTHPESSYPEEKSERMQAGAHWYATVWRLKRKGMMNGVRGAAKHVLTALGGAKLKEDVRAAIDRLIRYRY